MTGWKCNGCSNDGGNQPSEQPTVIQEQALQSSIEMPVIPEGQVTPCECKNPGFCDRHKCDKGAHFHKLCQKRLDYFMLWEAGKGPGQKVASRPKPLVSSPEREGHPAFKPTDKVDNTQAQVAPEETQSVPEQKMPGLFKQGKNFIGSAAKHIAGGAKESSSELFKARMDACNSCEFKTEGERCLKCGCFVKLKAKWESADCPIGKWPKEEDL